MPPEGPEVAPESGERREHISFSPELRRLEQTVGNRPDPLPATLSERQLTEMIEANEKDNRLRTFNEQYRNNELIFLRGSIQHQAQLEDPERRTRVNLPEFVVVNQAATYHEYFADVVNHVLDGMKQYEALRIRTPDISQEVIQGEGNARRYLQALEQALAERVAFANVLLIDGHLAQGMGDREELERLRVDYLDRLKTDATRESYDALQRDTDAKWRRGNALNQRIIDILAGSGSIEGVPVDFLPQRLYLDLLKFRYEQLLREQERIVRDPSLERTRVRHGELAARNELARSGTGPALSDAEAREYETLQRQLHDRNRELTRLGQDRRSVTQELVSFTNELGEYHIEMTELSTIQRQFGQHFDLLGASPVPPDQTPNHIREAIGKTMEERRQFHIERQDRFLHAVEDNVLHVGFKEEVEDLWNKNGHEAVRRVSNALATFFTFAVPETFGLREAARESLAGPLNEALGWPPDKMNVPFEKLDPDEQENIKTKSRSVLDAINEFDRTKIVQFRDTLTAIKEMPPASEFVGQDIVEPLPLGIVTPKNRAELVRIYGGPTVYAMLLRQLDRDFGSLDPPEGFIGEYAEFFGKIDDVIDVHLTVADALFQQAETYRSLARNLLLIALLALGFGIVIGVGGAVMITRLTTRTAGGALRLGGRTAAQVGTRTAARLGRLGRGVGMQGMLGRWWEAAPLQRAVWFGGMALQGYVAYEDLQAALEAAKFADKADQRIRNDLNALVDEGILTKVDENTYAYKDHVTINIKDMKTHTAEVASTMRFTADVVALGAMAAMGAKAFAGPPGWILIGVEVTVHTAIDAWQYSEYYEFVRKCPPWLLAKLGGTVGTVGESEYGLINDKFCDLFLKEKNPELRRRLFFSMLMRVLVTTHPDVLAEVTAGMGSPDALQELYENDYQKVFLPFFKAHLFTSMERADMPWDLINDLKTDQVLFAFVSENDIERSLLHSAQFLVQHIREKMYLSARKQLRDARGSFERAFLRSRVYELGSHSVFGRRLLDSESDLEQNNGYTRAELLAPRLHSRLLTTSRGGTWRDIMDRSTNGDFTERIPELKDLIFDTRTSAPQLSYDRNFIVSTREIRGLSHVQRGAGGQLWFRDRRLYDTDQPFPPPVTVAIPSIEIRSEDKPFASMVTWGDRLTEQRESILARAKALRDRRDAIVAHGGEPSQEELHVLGRDTAQYLRDLQSLEEETREYLTSVHALRGVTDEARRYTFTERGLRQGITVGDPALEKRLYANATHVPLLMVAGPIDAERDASILTKLVSFPDTLEGWLAAKNVRAVAIEKQVLPNGDEQFIATFVYSSDFENARPERRQYLQWAIVRNKRDSSLRMGMPIVSGRLDYLPTGLQNVLFDAAHTTFRARGREREVADTLTRQRERGEAEKIERIKAFDNVFLELDVGERGRGILGSGIHGVRYGTDVILFRRVKDGNAQHYIIQFQVVKDGQRTTWKEIDTDFIRRLRENNLSGEQDRMLARLVTTPNELDDGGSILRVLGLFNVGRAYRMMVDNGFYDQLHIMYEKIDVDRHLLDDIYRDRQLAYAKRIGIPDPEEWLRSTKRRYQQKFLQAVLDACSAQGDILTYEKQYAVVRRLKRLAEQGAFGEVAKEQGMHNVSVSSALFAYWGD